MFVDNENPFIRFIIKSITLLKSCNRKRNYFGKLLRIWLVKIILDKADKRPFDLSAIKTVLLLRDDGKIGDTVVASCLLRALSEAGYLVDVLATASNQPVIDCSPYVRQIFLREERGICQRLYQQNYDLVIDMGDRMSAAYFCFLSRFVRKHLLGFNKKQYNIFNKSISYQQYHSHISQRYLAVMAELQLNNRCMDYALFYPSACASQAQDFLRSLPARWHLVINPFTASQHRDLALPQLQEIISAIQQLAAEGLVMNIIVLDSENRLSASQLGFKGAEMNKPAEVNKLAVNNSAVNNSAVNNSPGNHLPAMAQSGVYKSPFTELHCAMALIAHASVVLSPDTSVVHIAAAWQKPLVALYSNDMHGKFNNNAMWAPNYPAAIQLTAPAAENRVDKIAVTEIIGALKQVFFSLTGRGVA